MRPREDVQQAEVQYGSCPAASHKTDGRTQRRTATRQSRYAAVNKAIAQASEQSYNISKLQAAGLLDADACTAKFNEINAQLAKLRTERRRLLENEDIDDAIDALQQTVDLVRHGPERLEEFDEGLFHDLVEQIVVESQTRIHFHYKAG